MVLEKASLYYKQKKPVCDFCRDPTIRQIKKITELFPSNNSNSQKTMSTSRAPLAESHVLGLVNHYLSMHEYDTGTFLCERLYAQQGGAGRAGPHVRHKLATCYFAAGDAEKVSSRFVSNTFAFFLIYSVSSTFHVLLACAFSFFSLSFFFFYFYIFSFAPSLHRSLSSRDTLTPPALIASRPSCCFGAVLPRTTAISTPSAPNAWATCTRPSRLSCRGAPATPNHRRPRRGPMSPTLPRALTPFSTATKGT